MEDEINKVKDEVRMKEWIKIIRECRSSGIPANQWLKQHNINQATYYRWQKIIRERIIEGQEQYNEIVEIKPAVHSCPAVNASNTVAAVITTADSKIEIQSDCPEWIIKTIIGQLC